MYKRIIMSMTLCSGLFLAAMPLQAADVRPVPDHSLPINYRLNPPFPTVKVLLEREIASTVIEVDGPYRVFNPADGCITGYGMFGKSYPVHATEDGLQWGESFPSVYQIAIVPASANTTVYVNGTPYPGSIYVYQVGSKISIINQARVEDFLKATLPSTFKSNMEEEALAAAVIAARTETYYKALRHEKAFWQLDAREENYHGYDCVKSREIDRAVDATRYLVIRSDDKAELQGLFPASWTEHCAGKTVAGSVMFRQASSGGTEGVQSPIAASDREQTAWSLLLKRQELAKAIGVREVCKVSTFKDSASDKVYAVRFQGSDGSREIDFVKLQNMLGKDKLQSSDFDVEVQGNIVSFSGHGQGNGVGLCLYSANRLASSGQDAVKVLGKFFPGTQVVMMPSLHPQQPELGSVARH